ncbi:MAG: ABC transporter ATP-binding protein [Candidatus Omnitrophota bacterium]|nr:ABC transporter ATP-binding protein [Candidatus Omnitrophota bacterium]
MIHSITLKNIRKAYDSGEFSLKIESLTLKNDRIHVIRGPNGCGKSTLLNLIANIEKPNAGNVLFNNEKLFTGLNKKIGFLTQKHYLFNTSVFENVALGLKLRNYPKPEITSKVTKTLSMLNINHLADRNVKNLSGGERQRTALAQVLVFSPQILLLDEPTANVDTYNIFAIEEALKMFYNQRKPLMIISTHSLNQAYRLSSNTISMNEGKIIDFLHENVFFGKVASTDKELQTMKITDTAEITFITKKRGNIYIAIDPENIIISKNTVNTSARNHFKGVIKKAEIYGPCVRLLIDIGIPLYVTITSQSFKDLGINLGAMVSASFKVNSVKVLEST